MNLPPDRQRLAKFVTDLSINIFGTSPPNEDWLDGWVRRAERADDPISFFEEFVAQKANVDRLARAGDSATRWPSGHFYSPVVSRSELLADWPRIAARKCPKAVNMQADRQKLLLTAISAFFPTIPFSDEKSARFRYHYENTSYAFGDALIYWSMLNYLRPSRIIEVGSGYTSALALDTIDLLDLDTKCTFIDPYPDLAKKVTAPLGPRHEIIPRRVQDVDLGLLGELGPNDILFIDSSHVVKTGSDAHFEITEMLPVLKSGVIVHFHDMFYPFEYPKKWAVDLSISWNEVYFLHAFLMYNSAFRIEYFNHYAATEFRSDLLQMAPVEGARYLINPGGGLWLRRQ
jgi:hypothetical protein